MTPNHLRHNFLKHFPFFVCVGPRRVGSAWLAQEAESSSNDLMAGIEIQAMPRAMSRGFPFAIRLAN